MFGRKSKRDQQDGPLDGGEGRGVPLGGQDDLPHAGYRSDEDQDVELEDRDYLWEEGDPADRRRDPLRKP